MQNANLFEQSLSSVPANWKQLFEATQSISVTLDLDTVLENAREQLLICPALDDCHHFRLGQRLRTACSSASI